MYKNNSLNSSRFKACSPLQLSCNLTRKSNAVDYYSYVCDSNERLKIVTQLFISWWNRTNGVVLQG